MDRVSTPPCMLIRDVSPRMCKSPSGDEQKLRRTVTDMQQVAGWHGPVRRRLAGCPPRGAHRYQQLGRGGLLRVFRHRGAWGGLCVASRWRPWLAHLAPSGEGRGSAVPGHGDHPASVMGMLRPHCIMKETVLRSAVVTARFAQRAGWLQTFPPLIRSLPYCGPIGRRNRAGMRRQPGVSERSKPRRVDKTIFAKISAADPQNNLGGGA